MCERIIEKEESVYSLGMSFCLGHARFRGQLKKGLRKKKCYAQDNILCFLLESSNVWPFVKYGESLGKLFHLNFRSHLVFKAVRHLFCSFKIFSHLHSLLH